MLKPNRSRNPNQLRIGGDLTPSQLVLAICVFLCAALICFSLGVIVGKYDERNSGKERERIALKPVQPQPNQRPLPVAAPGGNMAKGAPVSVQGVQTSPRPIVAQPSPGKPGYPESPGSGTGSVAAGPRVSEHPAPPKPAAGDGAAVSDPPSPEQPDGNVAGTLPAPPPAPEPEKRSAVETALAPAAQPGPEASTGEGTAGSGAAESVKTEAAKTEPPKAEAVKTEPAKAEAPNESPALEPVATPAAAVAAKPAEVAAAGTSAPGTGTAGAQAVPPDVKKGPYTVQLAALTSATRKEQGLGMKKKLEADGLQAELLISRDGARVSVVVGSYPDRPSAQAACNELRKNKGFSDCFVRMR